MEYMDSNLHSHKSKLDVAGKFTAFICLGLAALFTLSASIIIWQQKTALEGLLNESRNVVNAMFSDEIEEREARERAAILRAAKLLAQISPEAITGFELSILEDYSKVIADDPAISYVAFFNKDGREIAAHGKKTGLDTSSIIEHPIVYEGMMLGTVIVGYDKEPIEAYKETAKKTNNERMIIMANALKSSIKSSVISLVAIMIVIASGAAILTHLLFKEPLINLRISSLVVN